MLRLVQVVVELVQLGWPVLIAEKSHDGGFGGSFWMLWIFLEENSQVITGSEDVRTFQRIFSHQNFHSNVDTVCAALKALEWREFAVCGENR